MWVDHHGDTVIQEVGSNRRVELKFKPCGWFSKGWHEVEGKLYDDKTALFSIAYEAFCAILFRLMLIVD